MREVGVVAVFGDALADFGGDVFGARGVLVGELAGPVEDRFAALVGVFGVLAFIGELAGAFEALGVFATLVGVFGAGSSEASIREHQKI